MGKYFYIDANFKQQGPCSIEELRAVGITRQTKVWSADMPDWAEAGAVPELKTLFEMTPPPAAGNMQNIASAQKPCSCLVWAILSTIFCCLPFGIVSIVFAAKVDSAWSEGNYDLARESAVKARNWAIASAVSGVAISAIVMAFYGAIIAAAISGAM